MIYAASWFCRLGDLLVVLPKWQWTEKIVFHLWAPSFMAICYLFYFYSAFPEGSGFNSLAQVMIFFRSPYAALTGWIHYPAFDLFIAAWEVRDSQRRGVNHLLVIPCLIVTFFAGPVGLLLYFIIRFTKDRSLTAVDSTS